MSSVIVKENETLDSALRRFKRNCAKAGIQQEIRKREHYEKPSVKRKKKSEAARKRKYRILLYLYYYEGYSIRELTAILKRKESTLQTQLAAGRRKLKEELKKAGEIPQNWEREGK